LPLVLRTIVSIKEAAIAKIFRHSLLFDYTL
jgi:hypothetical protein